MTTTYRLRAWARLTARDPATLTATYDGDRIVEINGRADWAAEAMAVDAALVEAERQAAEEVAQAEYLAGVDVLPRPVQGKFETPAADGHVYGIEIDPTGDEIVPVQRESTRLTQAEYEAARAEKLTARAAHRTNLAAIKTDLDQVEAALDQIDATTTGPMGVAIAATSGATKTALTEVRKVIADMKTATKNLKQASEKLRREVR